MLSRRQVLRASSLLVATSFSGLRAWAEDDRILEVSGRIKPTAGASSRRYSFAELEALGLTSFKVNTPWYHDACTFEGVLLSRLMQEVGAQGETVRVSALDDYSASIPIADVLAHQPLLALRRDGRVMPVSDKGPLFLVYNYDALPELERQVFLSRSVWQVNRIEMI